MADRKGKQQERKKKQECYLCGFEKKRCITAYFCEDVMEPEQGYVPKAMCPTCYDRIRAGKPLDVHGTYSANQYEGDFVKNARGDLWYKMHRDAAYYYHPQASEVLTWADVNERMATMKR